MRSGSKCLTKHCQSQIPWWKTHSLSWLGLYTPISSNKKSRTKVHFGPKSSPHLLQAVQKEEARLLLRLRTLVRCRAKCWENLWKMSGKWCSMDRFKELVTGNHWFLPIDVCLFQGVPIDFSLQPISRLGSPKISCFFNIITGHGKESLLINHC